MINWYRQHWITYLLLPFSWLFFIIITIRRALYRFNVIKSTRFPVPVIVVGNITVGGTGKTPLVIKLTEILKDYKVGIVSRGYGVKKIKMPRCVTRESDPAEVGEEPALMAQRLDVPIVVCADRVVAVRELIAQHQCDLIISDDGLQHYRLERDIEIVVVDGERQFGNRHLLPAGPLREPILRAEGVDFVVCQGECELKATMMHLKPDSKLISVSDFKTTREFPRETVHAVAGIGYPKRFFDSLRTLNFDVIEHSFPDHYRFKLQDIDFKGNQNVVMTEKDAVKCRCFVDDRHWFLRVFAELDSKFERDLLAKLKEKIKKVS